MLAGDLYIADDPENGRLARRALQLMDRYQRAEASGDPSARSILAELLGHLGEDAYV
jgi:maltose O-acetyltransferase